MLLPARNRSNCVGNPGYLSNNIARDRLTVELVWTWYPPSIEIELSDPPVDLSHHSGNLDPELIVCVALVDRQPQASCILPQLWLQDVVQTWAKMKEVSNFSLYTTPLDCNCTLIHRRKSPGSTSWAASRTWWPGWRPCPTGHHRWSGLTEGRTPYGQSPVMKY